MASPFLTATTVIADANNNPLTTFIVLANSTGTEPPTVLGSVVEVLTAFPPTADRNAVLNQPIRFTTVPSTTIITTSTAQQQPTPAPPGVTPTGVLTPTTTAGRQTSTSTSKAVSSSVLGAGAVAGVAIGCLIAGALLALGIVFFFLRRRRETAASRHENGAATSVAIVAEGKGFDTPPPPPPASDKFQIAKFLLDSSSDKEIAAELRNLGTLIQAHVENNYHLGPVQVDARTLGVSLVQLGVGNGGSLDIETLAQLALEPRTRQTTLQHVISQVVFTSIDVSARSQLSMFPTPVAAFLHSIPPAEKGVNNGEVTSIALNKWRVLSAFLLHPARSQRTPLPASDAAIAPQAARLADALNTFLQYFVSNNETARFQQKRHLQDVIVECAKLGYVVLSQPSEWRFVHAAGGQGGRVAVICAGLAKVTDRDGTAYPAPNLVVPPTAVRL